MRTLLSRVWSLLMSPLPAAITGIFLAWQGLRDSMDRTQTGIATAVTFLVVHSIASYVYERMLPQRLARKNQIIARKILDLLNALGEISGKQYAIWKIDIYLRDRQFRRVKQFPRFLEAVPSRLVTVSLAASDPVPDSKEMVARGPVGIAFREMRSVLWLPDKTNSESENIAKELDGEVHDYLVDRFGALRVAPITDATDRRCIGVVAVSVEPADAIQMVGTVADASCKSAIREAALAIFDVIVHSP